MRTVPALAALQARARASTTRVRRIVHNLPVAGSVWQRTSVQGLVALGAAVVRVLPGGRFQTDALGRFPVLTALRAAAQGRHRESMELLRRAASGPTPIDRVVDALSALHHPEVARELAAGRRLGARAEARLLLEEGELVLALGRLKGVRFAKGMRALIRGELKVLQPHIVPRVFPVKTTDVRRVTHIVTTSLPMAGTGYTIRTQGIAEAQVRKGLTVEVFTRVGFPVDQGRLAANGRDEVDGVVYRRLLPAGPLPIAADARIRLAAQLLSDSLVADPPDVLHAHSKHDNAQVALTAGAILGIPVVYEARGFLEETWRSRGGSVDSDRYRLAKQAETACMLHADAVVTLSRSMRDDIVARGVPAHKVHLVPNAVSGQFLGEPLPQASERQELGLRQGARIVGMTGTLNHYEGLDTLIRAAALLADPDLELLIVGDGPARQSLQRLADETGVRVWLPGWVPKAQVRRFIGAMDVFCVPRSNTSVTALVPPLKPLEALAASVPIMVSDLPPLAELVADSQAGWCVPADDAEAWAEKLSELLAQPKMLAQRGDRGRGWVLRERTWERLASRYDAVYAQATERAVQT